MAGKVPKYLYFIGCAKKVEGFKNHSLKIEGFGLTPLTRSSGAPVFRGCLGI